MKRLEEAGLLDAAESPGDRALTVNEAGNAAAAFGKIKRRYFSLGIACPFLENESCGIHPERPMVCREYHVTSPAELCARLYDENVDRVDVPLRMGGILARTMAKITAGKIFMIPLVLSLEWSAAHSAELTESHDGRALMGAH